MTTFDDDDLGAERRDATGSFTHVVGSTDGHVGNYLCLGNIGRHDRSKGQEVGLQRINCIWLQEGRPRLRYHDRINHQPRDAPSHEAISDVLNNRSAAEHSCFHCMGTDVLDYRVDLGDDYLIWYFGNGSDLYRVLRRDGSDNRRTVDTECGEGLQVGLNSCTRARVRAGDGHGLGNWRCHESCTSPWREYCPALDA